MSLDHQYQLWAGDAALLAVVGQAMFVQATRVSVRLPKALADAALAAWERDDTTEPLPQETREQWMVRDRASALSLIGLAIQEDGRVEADEAVVDVDAWQIGAAFSAADEAGLLDGLAPPRQ